MILAVAAVLVLLTTAVAGVSWWRGRDTPPAPSLPKETATPTGDLRGELRPAAGSFVGYRVNETLIGVGLNAAVGRTTAVKGVAAVAGGRINAARFEIETGTEFSDYGKPPSVAGVASVRDHGKLEVRLRLR